MPPTRTSRNRAALSLLEAVVCLAILSVLVVPLLDLVTSCRRTSSSAHKLLEVTLQAETLLGAAAQLAPEDIPPVAPGSERVLLNDDPAVVESGTARWQKVVALFQRPPSIKMQRFLSVARTLQGELVFRVQVKWL